MRYLREWSGEPQRSLAPLIDTSARRDIPAGWRRPKLRDETSSSPGISPKSSGSVTINQQSERLALSFQCRAG